MTQAADVTNPEHVLLGIILTEPDLVDQTALNPLDLSEPRCERLWTLVSDRHAEGLPNTMMDLLPFVLREQMPGMDGGWLADLHAIGVLSGAHSLHHTVETVRQIATQRRLVMAGTRIAQMASVSAEEAVALEEEAHAQIEQVFAGGRSQIATAYEALDGVLADLAVPRRAPIPTPWTGLNNLINGWSPGRLYTLAAATGGGKSILMGQIARSMAVHGMVGICSLEMTQEEIIHRSIASIAKIDLGSLTNPPLPEPIFRQIERVAEKGKFEPLKNMHIDDRPNVTIFDIERFARDLARKGQLTALFVDYVQVVKWHGTESTPMRERLAVISWRLKALSKTLEIPVFMLAQVNRTGQAREKGEPTMNDLRDSADLENNSDAIIMVWIEDEERPEQAMMKVAKARGWRTGKFRLLRLGQYAMFDNADSGDFSAGWS
jgi:replicative DNA helicase